MADANKRPTRTRGRHEGGRGAVTRDRESTRAVDANERPSRREGGLACTREAEQPGKSPHTCFGLPIPCIPCETPARQTRVRRFRGYGVEGRLRARGYSGYRGFRTNTACLRVGVYPYAYGYGVHGFGCGVRLTRGLPVVNPTALRG